MFHLKIIVVSSQLINLQVLLLVFFPLDEKFIHILRDHHIFIEFDLVGLILELVDHY